MSSGNQLACLCTVGDIQNIVCKKWAILLIIELYDHKRLRYRDLIHKLNGISPATLASILKQLEKEKIIKRHTFDEVPLRVEYSLSKKGRDLYGSIIPLLKWITINNKYKIHSSFYHCTI